MMTLQSRIGTAVWGVITVVTALFSYFLYDTQRQEFLHGIDTQLLTGAVMARSIVGADYHDQIEDKNSVSENTYLKIVDSYNKICLDSGFQYLWSNLILDDGSIVFTSGTSTSKDVTKGDHALFFDAHSDPGAFQPVIHAGQATFSRVHNEWGNGRMLLIPYRDSQGRSYVFGASISINELSVLLQNTAVKTVFLFLFMLTVGLVVSIGLARAISRPLRELSRATERIAAGDYAIEVKGVGGGTELESLASSIDSMSTAIMFRNQELSAIIDNIPNMLFVKEADELRFIRFNKAGEELLGISRKNLIGKNDYDLFPAEQADFFTRNDRDVLESGKLKDIPEEPIETPGGTRLLHTRKVTIKDLQGKPKYLLGISEDITERKQAEEELNRFKTTLDKTLDCIFMFDPASLHFFYVNQGAQDQIGYRKDELMEMTPVDIKPEFDEPEFRKMLAPLISGEQSAITFDTVHQHKDGHHIPVEIFLQYIAPSGEAPRFVAIVRDISERKQVEEKLHRHSKHLQELVEEQTADIKAAKESAELANQAKSDFLANMSHEIRTPMNAIIGMSHLALQTDLNKKQHNYIEKLHDSGKAMLGLLNDILDFSKIEAGKLKVEARPFQLVASVEDIVAMMAERSNAKDLGLSVSFDKKLPPWVVGDSMRLQQILLNLLSNAIKFTNQGDISLTVTRQGEITRFQVADCGIGMNEEEISRLFTPFEQADSSTTRNYGGTGLGLAISYNLAGLMGGEIEVESQADMGSAFTLSLPLPMTQPPVSKDIVAPKTTGPQLEGLHILAAEDVEINRLILQDLLEEEGAYVEFAENGQQALDLLQAQGPSAFNVVLMDVQMPVMDGYEASRQIREMAPELPIIGLTAHALLEEREKCMTAGMVAHITKPIDIDILIAAIQQHV